MKFLFVSASVTVPVSYTHLMCIRDSKETVAGEEGEDDVTRLVRPTMDRGCLGKIGGGQGYGSY